MFMSTIGRKKPVNDIRNGLAKRSNGDKNYRCVEQSADFHKQGATVSNVNFARESFELARRRTRVPMTTDKISVMSEEDFIEKQRQHDYKTSVDEVMQLDRWKPAERIKSAFQAFNINTNEKKYRSRLR
jgi:hypothetical protein